MRKSGAGFAALARLISQPAPSPPAPLDFGEQLDLLRLRRCELHPLPETFTSEREELDALRAALARELEEVRALTLDSPLSYRAEPVAELYWRRPLAALKIKAEEAAHEEKARLKRQADEVRLLGLRSKKQAEKAAAKAEEAAAEEKARLKREADEARLLGLRSKKQAEEEEARLKLQAEEEEARLKLQADEEKRRYARDKRALDLRMAKEEEQRLAIIAAAHEAALRIRSAPPPPRPAPTPVGVAPTRPMTLTNSIPARPAPQPPIAGAPPPARPPPLREQQPAPARSSMPARPPLAATMTSTSALATRPTSHGEHVSQAAGTRSPPPPPTPARPAPAARPPAPARSPTPVPATPTKAPSARPAPPVVQTTLFIGELLPESNSPSTRPAPSTPATSRPPHLRLVPGDERPPAPPPNGVPAPDRIAALEERILDAVCSQDLPSYRAILAAVGGRRAVALATVQAMHDDGRLRLEGGVFRPGHRRDDRAGKRVSG